MIGHSTKDDSEHSRDPRVVPYTTISGQISYDEHSRPNSSIAPSLKASVLPEVSHTSYTLRNNVKVVDRSEGDNVERGRTKQRVSSYPNPLAKEESRPRFNSGAAIEVNMRPIKHGDHSRRSSISHFPHPTDPCADAEDSLLEPCPHLPACSTVTEELNNPYNRTASIKVARSSVSDTSNNAIKHENAESPSHVRTTGSRDSRPLQQVLAIPTESDGQKLPLYKHVQDICSKFAVPTWKSLSSMHPLDTLCPASLGAQLPTEILQEIFFMLSPVDFNSARHICRPWFISSLEYSLLQVMLSRGGWSGIAQCDIAINKTLGPGSRTKDEWVMSKRISRECALGPDWTGNGVSGNDEDNPLPKRSGFVHTCTIDFTEVLVPYQGNSSAGTIFTVSTCSKFLMVANGCLIYIYELNRSQGPEDTPVTRPGSLRPVTSIICPQRVLACSMDTSSRRHAVAVLLDGRMGLVSDIAPAHIAPKAASKIDNDNSSHNSFPDRSLAIDDPQDARGSQDPSLLNRVSPNRSTSNFASVCATSKPHFDLGGIATTASFITDGHARRSSLGNYISDSVQSIRPKYQRSLPLTHALDPESRLNNMLPPLQEKVHASNCMPIEMGPRSLYRNLCSDDDPPRSVAICPQRRCVAFGCSAGIELHWVDALTGQDLNRWFPLTGPSDYLFFLPPRTSIDSAKKLRLMSSAARPGERAAIGQRGIGETARNSPFWERLGYRANIHESGGETTSGESLISRLRVNTRNRAFTGRMDCSDHYRAVPLSDGYHILFTDPTTGLLCLGSDATVGGPTKLLRKIWFQGPEGKGSPVAYAGSLDLGCGVRVVAAFGSGSEQVIWFYSVPGDVFAANKGFQFVLGDSYIQTWSNGASHSRNSDWLDWWPDRGLHEWLSDAQDPLAGILPRSVWPVKIRGQEIGTCPALVDIAVDSGPSMTVWAFSKEGIARVWKINDGNNARMRAIWISRDGTIREFDAEGDLEMIDVSRPTSGTQRAPPMPLTQDSFDGTNSSNLYAALTARSGQQNATIELDLPPGKYDSDGDVMMEDFQISQNSLVHQHQAWSHDVIEAVAFLHHRGRNLYRSSRRSGHSYESIGSDFIEGLTGVIRIDVEIR
jgi:hypothetical protein